MRKDRIFKQFTAIEIVFMIFILIVVVLIVVNLLMRNVGTQKIEPYIENIQQLAKESFMRQYCDNLCSAIKTATNSRSRLQAMVNWCLAKITDRDKDFIDIIEDGIPGFFVVAGYPYCESGTYCFHFYSCEVGGIILDIKECRRILCQYFYEKEENATKATQNIKNIIDWGKCSVNQDVLRGKILFRTSAKWWYDQYFNKVEPENYCEALVTGGEVREANEEKIK
ncbi:MAG: hypothetical protein QXO40_02510 [Candidatus Aenigmatarchaeota archaeon]